jgi:hypothetical protein
MQDTTQRPTIRRRLALAGLLATVAVMPAALASTADAATIAAFDRYVSGKGFEIGMVNAATGASIAVPSGVNTNADEFHPALTPDGRYLVFTRATLQSQPDGDIVPPEQRQLLMVDRQTGQFRGPVENANDPGAGATITPAAVGQPVLAYGMRRRPDQGSNQRFIVAGPFDTGKALFVARDDLSTGGGIVPTPPPNTFVDVPQAAVHARQGARLSVHSEVQFDAGTGQLTAAVIRFGDRAGTQITSRNEATGIPLRPAARGGDGHVAFERGSSSGADIRTIQFPGDTVTTVAPAPITTSDPERMPAWSPDGSELGFVRTTGTTRTLFVFNTTQGLQTIVNPGVNLGSEAPAGALRSFQNVWGGLAFASPPSGSTTLSCLTACTGSLSGSSLTSGTTLTPSLSDATSVKTVGIFVSRVVGKRRVFGRRVARVRRIGRVPLGAARRGRNRFRWNGRVRGRRLKPGTYLLTFRGLNRRGRVLAVSRSLRFVLKRNGRVARVRLVR